MVTVPRTLTMPPSPPCDAWKSIPTTISVPVGVMVTCPSSPVRKRPVVPMGMPTEDEKNMCVSRRAVSHSLNSAPIDALPPLPMPGMVMLVAPRTTSTSLVSEARHFSLVMLTSAW